MLLDVVGSRMKLVDSALSIADQTAALLQANGLANTERTAPDYRFYVTDLPVKFQTIGERFLGRSLNKLELVQL
jgi:glutamate racemase